MTPDPGPRTPGPVSRASVLAWLAARRPEPPQPLRDQLARLVNTSPDSIYAATSMSRVMGDLGLHTLNLRLSTLDSAMDLLAADAFVTYAFEAASEEGTDVTGLADQLLARVRA